MNVAEFVEFNMKKYEIIKRKINNLEEINFTAKEFHLIFEMAELNLLNNLEMKNLILAFCDKLNPELSQREYDKIKSHHVDLP